GLPGRGQRRFHHRAGPHRRRRVYPVGAWGCMRCTSFSLKRKGSKETFVRKAPLCLWNEYGDAEELSSEVKSAQRGGSSRGQRPPRIQSNAPQSLAVQGVRRAAREAGTFPLRSSGKVTAFLGCEKV